MIPGHLPGAIDEHQRRRRRSAVRIEVGSVDRDGHIEQSTIKMLTDRLDVSDLLGGWRVWILRGVAVQPSRPDHLQSLRGKFRTQLRDDGSLGLAIAAPMRPEKQERRRP